MSKINLPIDDPLTPNLLDRNTELRALARAIELADGFSLLFACCNQPSTQHFLITELKAQFPNFHFKEIHFKKAISHLLDELNRTDTSNPPYDAILISGLEYSFSTAEKAYTTPFVANLNAARNSFGVTLTCPLVLWISEYIITAITQGAPDFFSVRSGIYHFAAMPENTSISTQSLTLGGNWKTANLSLDEKSERTHTIKRLLSDNQQLEQTKHNLRTEAQLRNRLGELYYTLGRWHDAEQLYQRSLECYKQIEDKAGEGATLGQIGNIYSHQEKWKQAEEYYKKSLAIHKEIGDQINEAAMLNNLNLGNLYAHQGHQEHQEKLSEVKKFYQQNLELFQKLGERDSEAATLNNLGSINTQQARWSEAEVLYQQSLKIYKELDDRAGKGVSLRNLGLVYANQGRFWEAKKSYQSSLDIHQQLGDRRNEIITLGHLAQLHESEQDFEQALTLTNQAIGILKTIENEIIPEKTRQLLDQLEDKCNTKNK